MNSPFTNNEIHRSGEIWPTHPMQGVPLYFPQSGFVVAGPTTRGCSQTEVIDLVDCNGDSFTRILVNRAANKSSKTRKRKLVVEPMDDVSLVKTVHPQVIDSEEWSLVRVSDRSDDDLEGFDEALKEMFDRETSTSVAAQHNENGLFNATSGGSLMVWDGGSLSFLDGFKDSARPTDFSDDDISAIGDHTDTVTSPEGFVRDGLDQSKSSMNFSGHDDDDDDDDAVVLQESHTCHIAPVLVDDQNLKASPCPFLERPTRMVSSGDEKPSIFVQSDGEAFAVQEEEFVFNISLLPLMFENGLVVPWDDIRDSPSTIIQDASAAPTHENVSSIPCSAW